MSFDRRVLIDIGPKKSLLALRVEGLRMTFEINKDIKPAANRAKIQIYNLAPDTRARIQELKYEVILRAGYTDEEVDEIFHGDIISISHEKVEGDVITTIEGHDGQTALRDSHSLLSYSEGTSLSQILKDVAGSMGIPVKSTDYQRLVGDQKFLQGFSFAGPTKDVLDKLTARGGLEWSIQGNQVQIIKKGGVVPKALSQIPIVSPDNGLIGSPERLQRIVGETPDKKPPGWRIKSSIIGRLEPGGQIGLKSEAVPRATALRIQNVLHKGDTHDNDFFSLTEAIEPGILI